MGTRGLLAGLGVRGRVADGLSVPPPRVAFVSAAKNPVPPAESENRHTDVAELSYEAARDELVAIVGRLEGGQIGLEESMRLWERGEALADCCAAWLDGAERRLRREDGTSGAGRNAGRPAGHPVPGPPAEGFEDDSDDTADPGERGSYEGDRESDPAGGNAPGSDA